MFKTGVVITGDSKGAVKAFRASSGEADKLRQSTDRASRSASALSEAYSVAAGKIGSALKLGAGFLTVAGAAVLRETAQQEEAIAQLNATLRSTGGVAGLAADELLKMASGLQGVTRYADDAIVGSQALLLTFTKVGRDVFPRAQEVILDLATAMKVDLKSATVQVGKALNDPILGLTSLSRAGIQFSESQKATIKALVESGRVVDAQKLVLAELETQFGGSARAARQTFSGAMVSLKNVLGDLMEGDSGSLEGARQSVEGLIKVLQSPETAAAAGKFSTALIDGFGGAVEALTKIPDFASIIGIQIGYLVEDGRIKFGLFVNVIESALAGLRVSVAKLFSEVLDTIADKLSELANIASNIPFADGIARQLDAAANSISRYGVAAESAAQARVDLLEKERAALLLAAGINESVRDDSIQLLIDEKGALEDAAVAAGKYGAATRDNSDIAEVASGKVDKLAQANRKLLESLRGDALSESEKALAQFEQRMSDLQGLLDAGLIGEGEFGDLSERFKTQYWDKVVGDAQDAKKQIEAVDPFASMRDTLVELSTDWGRATANIVTGIQAIQKANTGMFGASAKGWGMVAAGASQYFDEGSDGYKVLQAASQAFYTFEIAQQAASAIASLTASETKATGHATAAVAAGTEAVATQASAGPYVGFAMAAAMVAFLASVGIKLGGGASGGVPSIPRGDANKGTGSVLGDVEAQSESIARSIEQLVSLDERGLNVARSMLTTLNSIDANIKGVSAGLAQNFLLTGNATPFNRGGFSSPATGINNARDRLHDFSQQLLTPHELLTGGGPLTDILQAIAKPFTDIGGRLISGILGSTKIKQVDSGLIFAAGQTLGDVLADGIDAAFFATIKETTKRLFGLSKSSKKPYDVLQDLDSGLSDDITSIIVNLGETVLDAVDLLGLDLVAATDALNATELGIGKVSLQGLSGTELQERLTAVFSALGDRFAEAAVPAITEFQRVGEGALETLIRIASQTAYTVDALEALGQSIEVLGDPLGAARAADALINLAGGFDQFRENTAAFLDFALTDQQKMDQLGEGLTELFADLGYTLPDSREGVLELVQGLDLLTEEGQNAYTAITAATPAMEVFFENMEKIAGLAYDFDTALGLNDGMDAARQALASVGLSMEDLTEAMQRFGVEGVQNLLGSLDDAAKAILEPFIGDILNEVLGSPTVNGYLSEQEAARKAAADAQARALGDAKQSVLNWANSLTGTIASLNTPDRALSQLQAQFDTGLAMSGGNRASRIAGLEMISEVGPELQRAIIANAATAQDAQFGLAVLRSQALDAVEGDVPQQHLAVSKDQLDVMRSVNNVMSRGVEAARANSERQVQAINQLGGQLQGLRAELSAMNSNTAATARILERVIPDGDALAVRTAT